MLKMDKVVFVTGFGWISKVTNKPITPEQAKEIDGEYYAECKRLGCTAALTKADRN